MGNLPKLRNLTLFLLLFFILSSGCTTPADPIEITSHEPCAQITNDANLDQVNNCFSESFEIEGKKIELVSAHYGPPQDCPSGCFFDHYCGVIEDGVSYRLWNFGGSYYSEELELYPRAYLLTELTDSKIIYSDVAYVGGTYTTKSQCFSRAMDKLFYDDEDCLEVPDGKFKEMCVEKVQYRKDHDFFKSLNQSQITLEDCQQIETLSVRDFCYSTGASKRGNPEFCDFIEDSFKKNYDCFFGMYRYVQSLHSPQQLIASCEKINPSLPYGTGPEERFVQKEGTLKDNCFYHAALRKDDKQLCDYIQDNVIKAECILEA